MECKSITIVIKLVSSSFTNANTLCNKPNLFNKDQNYITFNYFVEFKQPHNNMHGTQVLPKNLITKTKISILAWDIQRSKLIKITIVNVRFGKTWWSIVFLTMANNISFKNENIKKQIKHKGINLKLTFENKCSHKWTRACNPCKYKTTNALKIVIEHRHFFGKGL
jgi:hypothetical protein